MKESLLFVFILCIIYILRYGAEVGIKLIQEDPNKLRINTVETIFIYLSLSYIITYIIT